ncbi:MAG: Tetratricopeptide repeat/TPR repeat/Hemolysin-type calcium-binding repeat (2 copies) [Phormidium sp. OSCR]|nr:MAG: Tetratricopeptide repeat/TPR repeat/Hemolysin-type calcium-binding repeat (2 copies) [Phormidium sp. OSCR]
MVLDISSGDGFDFGLATSGNDTIFMEDLPPDQLNRLQSSSLTGAIALLDGNDYLVNDDVGRVLFGNEGDDTIIGGAGDDTIFGGQENDSIVGGEGNDLLSGDRGFDTLTGGGGANQFIVAPGPDDRDVITDFTVGRDKMILREGVALADVQIQNTALGTLILQDGAALSILQTPRIQVSANDFLTNEDFQTIQDTIRQTTNTLQQDSRNADAYNERGQAFSRLGRQEDAIEDFTRALSLDPAQASVYYTNRGRAFFVLRDQDSAIEDYTQAIRANPNNAAAFFGRGVTYSVFEDYELAIEDYTRAIRLNPNDWVSYFNRGLDHSRLEQYDEAIADLTQAIRLDPDDVLQYSVRASAYEEIGELEAAVEDYERIIELDPNFADAHYRLGLAYRELSDETAAQASFEEAARLYERQGNQEGLDNVAQELDLTDENLG